MTRDDRGSALVETVFVGLLMLLPLIWLLGVLADMHRGALASTAAAREAGADAARSTSLAEAERAIDAAVAQAFLDHGLDPSFAQVRWSAANDMDRGGAVEIEVTYSVSVVQAPLLGQVAGPAVDVSAQHVGRIDPYRSRS